MLPSDFKNVKTIFLSLILLWKTLIISRYRCVNPKFYEVVSGSNIFARVRVGHAWQDVWKKHFQKTSQNQGFSVRQLLANFRGVERFSSDVGRHRRNFIGVEHQRDGFGASLRWWDPYYPPIKVVKTSKAGQYLLSIVVYNLVIW